MLGIIPTWQFSSDPNINPSLNRFVPSSPAWQKAIAPDGLGYVMVDADRSVLMPPTIAALKATGQISDASDWFRAGGWVYENRKALFGAGVAIGAIALALRVL